MAPAEGINAKDMQELRCLTRPPSGTEDVLAAAVCAARGSPSVVEWADRKEWLTPQLIDQLAEVGEIPDDALHVATVLFMKHSYEDMRKKSLFVAALHKWLAGVLDDPRNAHRVKREWTAEADSAKAKSEVKTMEFAEWEAAVDALSKLSKADVGEARNMEAPSPEARAVASALALLLGGKEDWETFCDLLKDPRLLSRMLDEGSFESYLTSSTRRAAELMPSLEVCTSDTLQSSALVAISKWVHAVCTRASK